MRLKLAMLAFIGGLAYLSLAVFGWGGLSQFLANPARVVVSIVTLLAVAAALCTQGNMSTGQREDRGNRWVLAWFTALGLALGYFPALAERHEFWTIDGDTIRWIGVTLYIIGGILRMYPVFVLGRRFSGFVAIQPGHTLVTDGIYAVVRHPSYLGLLVNAVGWSFTFRSTVGLILTALMLIPLVARMNSEENLLLSEFGDEYERFRAQTRWRLIPGLY